MSGTPRLKLTEIFRSLQGEADTAGIPTVFIRLTGCPLRCVYCDTAYAFSGGQWWTLPDILARVAELKTRHVCVTGGEPLAQAAVHALLSALCEAGYRVSLETSGAMSLAQVDSRVVKVVDVKTPASGEERRNRYEELERLTPADLLKFVIADRADYEWSREQVRSRALDRRCGVLFSPSHEILAPGELADWMLADGLNVRLQVQLHKYLWGNAPGR
ncbi:MAG: 7-carboxy-7-deazaguanine synthase QueE [Steroidobacteraceae bacterium]|jgi:7-carboxy-7-deazaguanine synthase|nr:7-carboxy-7-deazaguanine synthase QueE [Gammaproteobacteria bacterium]